CARETELAPSGEVSVTRENLPKLCEREARERVFLVHKDRDGVRAALGFAAAGRDGNEERFASEFILVAFSLAGKQLARERRDLHFAAQQGVERVGGKLCA